MKYRQISSDLVDFKYIFVRKAKISPVFVFFVGKPLNVARIWWISSRSSLEKQKYRRYLSFFVRKPLNVARCC